MVEAASDTSDLLEMVTPKDMIDNSLSSHDKESMISNELMKTSSEDESQAEAQSDSSSCECEFEEQLNKGHHQVQPNLSKTIVRPWEELQFKRNRHGLGYANDNNFHIPYYSKLVMFVSAGFLDGTLKDSEAIEDITLLVEDNHMKEILECQHCHRVGHMEDQCFDLHSCLHCGKTNHHSDKCRKKKQDQLK